MLDDDQKLAVDLAIKGHNLLITGQAGCGKTYVVKQIVSCLRSNGRNVALVCSTGIAATHYGNLGAQTLHRWAGLEDGRHLNEELLHFLNTDERFENARSNILSAETLIIDEVSMISAKVLNQVQFLCRHLRDPNTVFGNIQVILVGDFYQLPPVCNQLYGDSGKYCFTLPWFNDFIPHKIVLHLIHRQSDNDLITSINELEKGEPSDKTVAMLNSLNRPLQHEATAIQLFATNFDVDLFNYKKLQNMDGELKIYNSADEGSTYYLSKFLAPKKLGLKIGCPVMLLKNLSPLLVNGLRGVVSKLDTDSIDVRFILENKTITTNIKRDTFTTFNPVSKTVLAKRVQFPVKAAYAITIHKSQGMSLENVVVNCQNCGQAGQIGVAIGHAVSVDGLRVVNFKKSLCKPHSVLVKKFYENISLGDIHDDMTCCKNNDGNDIHAHGDNSDDNRDDNKYDDSDEYEFENFESDFSDTENENLFIIDEFDDMETLAMQESPSKTALECVVDEFIDTPTENTISSFKNKILSDFKIFDDWFLSQFSIIEDICLNCFPEGEEKFSQKHKSDFFVKFNKYMNSNEYDKSVMTLLNYYKANPKGPQFQLLTSIMFYIEKEVLLKLSSHLKLDPVKPVKNIPVSVELSAPGRGKLRYVSGYVLAKLKYGVSKKLRASFFVSEKKVSNLQSQMKILNSLCISYDALTECTSDLESLNETSRKQNEREGLTNIRDSAFNFFKKLEIKCRDKLSNGNLVQYGKRIFSQIKDDLYNDSVLFQDWLTCFTTHRNSTQESLSEDINDILSSVITECESSLELFNSIITLFLKVNLSQFRRDYLTSLKQEKCKALRKKVMQKTKKSTKSFDIQFFNNDTSAGKESSHLRLKSELIQNKNFLLETSFTKQDLLSLCKSYCLKISAQKRKVDINNELVQIVLEQNSMSVGVENQTGTVTNLDEIAGPSGVSTFPTTSSQQVSTSSPPPTTSSAATPPVAKKKRKMVGKGKGKGKKRGKAKKGSANDSDENCGICNAGDQGDETWICCDICSLWYHRDCLQIDDEEWLALSDGGKLFSCPLCQ